MTNTIKLEAGPELDAAVAEACGFRLVRDAGPCRAVLSRDVDNQDWVDFCPSTDHNAAFAAAEIVGLFDSEKDRALSKLTDELWVVERVFGVPFLERDRVSEGSTPALAICAAILKLKVST